MWVGSWQQARGGPGVSGSRGLRVCGRSSHTCSLSCGVLLRRQLPGAGPGFPGCPPPLSVPSCLSEMLP